MSVNKGNGHVEDWRKLKFAWGSCSINLDRKIVQKLIQPSVKAAVCPIKRITSKNSILFLDGSEGFNAC